MYQTSLAGNFDLIKSSFYFLKLFGFFPFSIDFLKKNVSVKVFDLVQLISALLIWFSLTTLRVVKTEIFAENSSRFGRIGESADGVSGYLILTITVVGNFLNRRDFIKILKCLDKFDQKVSFRTLVLTKVSN